ncbi:peroxidase 12-like [Bidens hawaiensis]|uniref:peroxidase 12-like n=1 Tax=Bidens hawaiensis TaxID=980011 RepID=UPI004049B299
MGGSKMTSLPFHTFALGVGVLVVMVMHLHGLKAQKHPLVKGLSWKFYESKCPKLESIIRKQMEKVIKKDVGLAASLLRVHFHDYFVQGCDGSVLLDGSASGPLDSEKTAPPNLRLRGFDVIEDLRRRVHKECGAGSVSCSDITTIVARDSIVLTGGPKYNVPLGRRDGLTFATRNVTLADLPSPFVPVNTLLTNLAAKNFDTTDVVAMSGAHTIGDTHCTSFTQRLYPTQDTTMDKPFASTLKDACPTATTNATTFLDVKSPKVFDNKYFVNLVNKQGVLGTDQDLYTNKRTRAIVTSFAGNQTLFFEKFVDVMVTMGQMNVLTGKQGEIHNNCFKRNTKDMFISSVVGDMNNVGSF